MSRVLIGPSALTELLSVEPLSERRRLVGRLSELGRLPGNSRISGGGCCRLLSQGLRVLYRRREDGTLVVTGIRRLADTVSSPS